MQVQQAGGFGALCQRADCKEAWERLCGELPGVQGTGATHQQVATLKLRKLYEQQLLDLDVRHHCDVFLSHSDAAARADALQWIVQLMDLWLEYEGADGKRAFDVVETLWTAVGQDTHRLVTALAQVRKASKSLVWFLVVSSFF